MNADNRAKKAELTDLHGERAALRGNPSLVWRAGQNRRLQMILDHGAPKNGLNRVLVNGCGTGMYVQSLQAHLVPGGQIYGIDIEDEHLTLAAQNVPDAHLQLAACEHLPYPDNCFDLILSHEVLEHVQDDAAAVSEMVRALGPGGRLVIFVPNRLYPFETHGHYWRGEYHFGNTPLINYLPHGLRNQLAPHVRAYTSHSLHQLLLGYPVRISTHTQIFPGYDNIVYRRPALGRLLRTITYTLEHTPLTCFGISHFLVAEKIG